MHLVADCGRGMKIFAQDVTGTDGQIRTEHFCVADEVLLDRSNIVGMTKVSSAGGLRVHMEFNAEGKEKLAQATRQNAGQFMAIFLDGKLIAKPIIETPILDGKMDLFVSSADKERFLAAFENSPTHL
jgi:preprotein translocase subunit SecD